MTIKTTTKTGPFSLKKSVGRGTDGQACKMKNAPRVETVGNPFTTHTTGSSNVASLPKRVAYVALKPVILIGQAIRFFFANTDLVGYLTSVIGFVLALFYPIRDRLPSSVLSRFEDFAITHRGILVCIFLLPVSGLYELYRRVLAIYNEDFAPPPAEDHIKRVERVQQRVRAARAEGRMMCTARPGWKSMSLCEGQYKKTMAKIEVDMQSILGIDEDRRVVKVEPLVTTGMISRFLIKRGWTLPVTPELDDLTIGGLIMGFGIESSSHKYGLFQHICLAFEVVLPSGEFVRCSRDEMPDLFATLPWSHGTIGFLVAAEVMIIPAKKYVKLTYNPCHTKSEYMHAFKAASRLSAGHDVVETLLFTNQTAVVMTGVMVDEDCMLEEIKAGNGGSMNPIGKSNKEWFYLHVQKFLNENQAGIEYIPLRDYYHRHTRSIFWELKEIIPFGDEPWCRNLLGWLMPPNISLMKLTQTKKLRELYEKQHVVQDMLVPMKHLSTSIDIFHQEFEIYPLWLCPMRLPRSGPGAGSEVAGLVHPPNSVWNPEDGFGRREDDEEEELYVDVGAYGTPRKERFDHAKALQRVESFVISVHGFQALYADTRMTKKQFWQMFDPKLYLRVRKEVGALEAFPDVYDKVSRAARRL